MSSAKREIEDQLDNRWREETETSLDAIRYSLKSGEEKQDIISLLLKLATDIKNDFEDC